MWWLLAFISFLISALTTAEQALNKYVAVAAIDFGTARSGWAFAMAGQPDKIVPSGYDGQKQPTCIILKRTADGKDYTYTHFGEKAQQAYTAARTMFLHKCHMDSHGGTECEPGKWDDDMFYFEKFKMQLYNREAASVEELLDSESTIASELKAANGQFVSTNIVFREALRYMKDRVLAKLNGAKLYGTKLNGGLEEEFREDQVQWVITIPGMWTEPSKTFMKNAAEAAGMGLKKKNLMFALEPEAASFEVRATYEHEHHKFGPGVKYIVVDAGGGTIDFACHEINDEGRVNETHRATGDAWGSTYLDQAYEALLSSWFDYPIPRFQNFKKDLPDGYQELMQRWETCKHQIEKIGPVGVKLPAAFSDRIAPGTIMEVCEEETGRPYCYIGGTLTLPESIIKNMYEKLINKTVQHVRMLLSQPGVQDSKYLFLVGGFGESEILKAALIEAFADTDISVVRPNHAGMAVIHGAIKYGFNPSQIASRKALDTYGIQTCINWTADCKEGKKYISKDKREYCCDIFSVFVEKDDVVETDREESHEYLPLEKDQTSLKVGLYTSKWNEPQYVDDLGVTKRGEILVDMSDMDGYDRTVEVKFKFGRTMVEVVAFYGTTEHKASIKWIE